MQPWTLHITQPIFGISRFLPNELSNVTFLFSFGSSRAFSFVQRQQR